MKPIIPKTYWAGEGRNIIVIPNQVLIKQKPYNALSGSLYITEMGYYPIAANHYTHRKNGCPENILIYCTKGCGWLNTPKGKYAVMANHFFILPCNTAHEYGAADTDPWSVYWIKFGGRGLNALNDLAATTRCFEPKHFAYQTDAVRMFDDIFNVLKQGYSRQYLVYINMILINFLTLFLFQYSSGIKKVPANIHDHIIQTAISYMQENLNRDVTLAELAAAAGCSCSQLSRLFKTSAGYSPINYFNHLKIQKACQYLYTTNALIKEIAGQLGYDDPYYFSRLFTQIMGISPNQYRSRHIQK